MRKMLLGLAAMVVLVTAKLAAQTEVLTDYDAHIDKDGKVHCINDGNKCRSW